ncbi:hypothetical protein B5K11_15785 [Rhizobium leguminosarum bv. trifolii]|uniref:hypothetical protein n=1 Tax=Rhizobium leguminosarum TaxID=384 RepID=UPI000E2F3021|nr:hypothetical protein [Rhizobium leguminosarum]RFB92716.1 hypothetical protein B5K11_15785 [Rhizobium leguminosarum bv. trifolii]
MTLIASFMWRGFYFAFGDTLITTGTRIHEDIPIPTQNLPNETEQIEGSEIRVAGLTRKIFTIGPHLVFGWSGPMANFENGLRYLYAAPLDEPLSLQVLQAILNDSGLPKDRASAWFIYAFTRDGAIVGFSHNMRKIAQEKDGIISVAGSGAESFRERLEIGSAANIDAISLFTHTLNAQARYPIEQHRQGRHLDKGFGGGFEFILSENGSFVSFDRVMIVYRDYWDVEEQNEVRKDVQNVSRVGNTFSKVDAVYYMTHVDHALIVGRWFPDSHKMFWAAPPFSEGQALAGTPRFGVDHVFEVMSHHSGRRSTVFNRVPDEYDFEVIGEDTRLTFPMTLPEDLETALREHIGAKAR